MNKWRIIAKHEYLTNIKRKEFLFITFVIPLFIFAIMGLSFLLIGIGGHNEENKIGYVDNTGLFDPSNLTKYTDEDLARKDLLDNKITNYFVIPENYTATGKIIIYSSKKNFADNMKIEEQIRNFLLDNLLKNEPSDIIQRIKKPLDPEYFTLNEKGLKSEDSGFEIILLPLVFSMLFSISIFASSGFLLQSVIEEKENRIMEVILSSVSHKDLLTGKIIGLGALGLTQVFIYLTIAAVILLINPLALYLIISQIHISIPLLAAGIIYFILGYIVFAGIMAGVGAIATTSREGQQIAVIFSLTGSFPFMFSQFIVTNPNEIFAKALSIFPLTSPITMIMRLSVTDVPLYEIMISIIVLVFSAYFTIEISVRIFRASLLMYGKKPTIKELIKYVRQD